MKRHIVTLIAILCCHIVLAQTEQTKGSLIVKEYSPDEWKVINQGRTYVDMDDDGEWDFYYRKDVSSSLMSIPVAFAKNGACFHRIDIPGFEYNYPDDFNSFRDFGTPLNDSTLIWSTNSYGPRIFSEKNWVGHYHLDTLVFKSAIRNGTEGEYYYGWMEAYSVVTYNYDSVWFYLARTAYCTIPNYPLRWGQTSLFDGIEETEATASATLHPNPTTGLVTITGENLKAAEVFNTLGQNVATATGEGETMQVDLSGLPAGVYFVNVTDKDGRKCVRKVVKE
ncbi:MAG: T9SS type A sorting domain-containing protein [Bacteroidales bacterium]|nr:T9SS type A sorting domain-containing protein [Bacteroidales bacterium]